MSKHRLSSSYPVVDYDFERAHSGRIHTFLLSGKDAYRVDQDAGAMLVREAPLIWTTVRMARTWLVEAVRYLAAEEDVRQFVELGCGYPHGPNVHEVVGPHHPDTLTLYVDHDPVVAAHARALLPSAHTHFLHADIRDTETIVTELKNVMDLARPVALCMSSIAEFLDDPAAVIDPLTSALPRGSYLVISHVTRDENAESDGSSQDHRPSRQQVDCAVEIYDKYSILFRPRSREEIEHLLVGYDLLEPGLVSPLDWHSSTQELELDQLRAEKFGRESPRLSILCSCYVAVGRSR